MMEERLNPPAPEAEAGVRESRVYLLGGFRVQVSGRDVPDSAWGRPAARRLLKLLAAHPGHRLHRERVHDELWPELGPDTVDASLRRALHLARHALEPDLPIRHPSSFITLRDDLLWLNDATVLIDADQFEADVRRGIEQCDAIAIARGLDMYQGDLLPEDQYEEWTQVRREQLANLRLAGEVRIASLLIDSGQEDRAQAHLQTALQADPASEEAYRLLMTASARKGDQRQAIRAYERCRAALEEELGVEPSTETDDLHRRILNGELPPAATPPAITVRKSSVALPRPSLPLAVRPQETDSLFGRAEEWDAFQRWLVARHAGEGAGGAPMLTLVGDMGSGKTHLARAAAKGAYRDGTTVLWGGWSVDSSRVPYSGLVQALDHAIPGRAQFANGFDMARYPELDRLLPSMAAAPRSDEPSFRGDPQTERARLLSSVARLLSDLEATGPLLIVFDDLQDSDEASREVLEYLLRLGAGHRWAFLATVRDPTPETTIGTFIAPLRRGQQIEELRLGPLSPESTEQLIQSAAATPPDVDRLQEIYRLSRGNPLFTLELMRDEGSAAVTGAGIHPLPSPLIELVLHRLEGMEKHARSVAHVTSAMGDQWTFGELQLVMSAYEKTSPPDTDLLEVLEAIEREGVVEERGDEFAFRHPVYRAALYESMSRERRRQLHGAIARAFEATRSDDVDALALHFELAREADRARHYLELAGDRAVKLYANVIAEQRYMRVLENLNPSTQADRARMEEKLGRVLFIMGRLSDAEAALESALSWHTEHGDLDASARVLSLLARVSRSGGRAGTAIPRLQQMAATLRNAGAAGLGEVTSVLSRLMITVGRYEEGVAVAEEAMELTSASSNEILTADAVLARSTGLLFLGRLQEGKSALEEVIVLGRKIGDLNMLQVALANLAEVDHLEGRFQDSIEHHTQALEIVQQMGDPNRLSFAESAVGIGLMMVGRWQEARVHLETARDVAEQENLSWYSSYPLIHLGRLELYCGRTRSAEQLLHRALDLARSGDDLQAERFAESGLAECDLEAGRFQSALERLTAMSEGEHQSEMDITSLLPSLALAFMGVGNVDRATATAELAVSRTESEGAPAETKEALIVLGRVLTRVGQLDRAREVLERSLEMASSMGDLFAQARGEDAMADLRAKQGDDEAAAAHKTSATRLFKRIGARPVRASREHAV